MPNKNDSLVPGQDSGGVRLVSITSIGTESETQQTDNCQEGTGCKSTQSSSVKLPDTSQRRDWQLINHPHLSVITFLAISTANTRPTLQKSSPFASVHTQITGRWGQLVHCPFKRQICCLFFTLVTLKCFSECVCKVYFLEGYMLFMFGNWNSTRSPPYLKRFVYWSFRRKDLTNYSFAPASLGDLFLGGGLWKMLKWFKWKPNKRDTGF